MFEQRNRVTPKLAPLYDAIRARVAERPDGTIEELRAWLLAAHAMSASVGLIWKTLRQLGLTLKKSHSARPNRIGRTLPRRARNGARSSQPSILPG